MRDCVKVEIEKGSTKIYNELYERGMRVYSHNEEDRDGYCYTTIVSYGEKLFELRDCCGIKTVHLILTRQEDYYKVDIWFGRKNIFIQYGSDMWSIRYSIDYLCNNSIHARTGYS